MREARLTVGERGCWFWLWYCCWCGGRGRELREMLEEGGGGAGCEVWTMLLGA